MKKIDLKKLIQSGVNELELANALFPDNKFSPKALARMISQNIALDETQIIAICNLTGLTIHELYEENWKSHNKEGVFYFEKDGFKAELDTKTLVTRVRYYGKQIDEQVISSKFVLLSEYLNYLDLLIEKLKK